MNQGFQSSRYSEDIINALKENYCLYRQKYVVMSPEYTKTTPHYFKDGVLESHLDGRYAVGVFAGNKATRFITFDVDAGGKAAVRKVVGALTDMGFPEDKIYVSTSGRKGYHVDIFFEPYIYNEKAKNIYDIVIWMTGLDPKKIEFRPTHTQAIKLPLGVHAKTGNRCWFLDTRTLDPIEDMYYVCGVQRIPSHFACEILKKCNRRRWNELYIEMVCEGGDTRTLGAKNYTFADREKYFDEHRLTAKNTRHDMMLKMARDIRYNGASAGQIEKFLMGWYYKQDPVYITSTEEEVREDAKEIAEWAEENVPVLRTAMPPKDLKPIVFTKEDINYILMAPTSAARKVALLLWTYCKMYGATKISYDRIAETTGCVRATVQTAVTALIKGEIVHKQSGGLHVNNGKMIKKSNTYFIPQNRNILPPPAECLLADEYAYTEQYSKDNFEKYYYSVLAGLCTDEYLARFLTGTEMENIKAVRKERIA